jgi:cephalosporin-C deacetylase-like acetyl esterase
MNDLGAPKDGRVACWPKARTGKTNKGNEAVVDSILPYYDVALHAGFSKAAFWIEIGLADGTCPAPAVWSGVNRINGECNVHPYPFRTHYKPVYPYLDWWKENIYDKRIEWIRDHLK